MQSPIPIRAALGLASLGLSAAFALIPFPGGGTASAQGQVVEAGDAGLSADEKARRAADLKAIEEALAGSVEAQRQLEREIAEIKADRARLAAALIEASRRTQATEERVRALEQRLAPLLGSEAGIRRSLEARRGVIVEVLAALQRMGRRPPPAVLVAPEDMLSALRTSMLLGAVLPELRGEAQTLAEDLSELVRLRAAFSADRDMLRTELGALARERVRLDALVAARQSRGSEIERQAGSERERAEELGAQAASLKELIERTEREAASRLEASEETKRRAEARVRESRERFAAAAIRDPVRLAPKTPFAEARGLLQRPVIGEVARAFGSPDGAGGATRGVSIATRPRAVVSLPADGSVVFAGPFRSLGRLLIIDAGQGYYLLLAGMDQISVEVGQFVLAGEPVGVMGDTTIVSPVSGASANKDPIHYVEFRKDGGSIDPGPWWAKSQGEKARG